MRYTKPEYVYACSRPFVTCHGIAILGHKKSAIYSVFFFIFRDMHSLQADHS